MYVLYGIIYFHRRYFDIELQEAANREVSLYLSVLIFSQMNPLTYIPARTNDNDGGKSRKQTQCYCVALPAPLFTYEGVPSPFPKYSLLFSSQSTS